MLTHVDLFSGIGGFALAARWAGVETIAFAEIDPYASRVLERHFSGVRNYGRVQDVPAMDAWLVTGGVPCQPASVAGKRLGTADDRWLWPEALAAVERIKPEWVLFENPTGILSLDDGVEFERICLALEGQGYEVQSPEIPAAAVGAKQRRDRCWIVAYSEGEQDWRLQFAGVQANAGASSNRENVADPNTIRQPQSGGSQRDKRRRAIDRCEAVCNPSSAGLPDWFGGTVGQPSPLTEFERPSGREVERDFRGMAHGVSRRVDRLKCLGNAIVPQVAYQLIKRMIEAEALNAG